MTHLKKQNNKTAIIIGAGPAGLTAAYELLKRTDIKPLVLEKTAQLGGISRTENFKGNRIDIGGHRFFSKSTRVTDWWSKFLPVEDMKALTIGYPGETGRKSDPEKVMLVRKRISRIYYLRKFFSYPINLNFETLKNLGLVRVFKIGISFSFSKMSPIRDEKNLEDFFINRFGQELYRTFFKDYTEKVWGKPCSEISAEWGAQRIKKLSVFRAVWHTLKTRFRPDSSINQRNTDTSLINKFLYPKYGPGQLWEEVAAQVTEMGSQVLKEREVKAIRWINSDLVEVTVFSSINGEVEIYQGNYLFSTMPVKELIAAMGEVPSEDLRKIGNALEYRDFITVGILAKRLTVRGQKTPGSSSDLITDNWIYIQDSDVRLGRLQIFNNWSPYLVADHQTVWLGLEYFCDEKDDLWVMKDNDLISFAGKELESIGIISTLDVIDGNVIRVPKAYPAYFGSYREFDKLKKFTDSFDNMYLIGRNGMHKYNNQDHSILTAMVAVDNIVSGRLDKQNIWKVNTEQSFHEETDNKSI